MDTFSNRLKQSLIDNNLSQKDLAEKIGMSKNIVSDYCNNKKLPSIPVLIAICKTLNESADYLLGLDD